MTSAATSLRADTAPANIAGWAVLAIDELWLALPQRDVRQFQLASDMETSETDLANAVGQIVASNGESWPVYNLDGSLKLQQSVPEARGVCIFFETEGERLGLLCDRVWPLDEDAGLTVDPMPGCMKGRSSPITGLAQFQNRIAMVTNGAALSSYLAYLLEQDHVERGN